KEYSNEHPNATTQPQGRFSEKSCRRPLRQSEAHFLGNQPETGNEERPMQMIRRLFIRLRHEPAFAAIFVITLALGVGANAALLSALHGYYLAPLPYRNAGQLVNIQQDFQGLGGISIGSYHDVLSNTKEISDGALAGTERITISANQQPRSVLAATVAPSLFPTLGVTPAMGRALQKSAGQIDGPREAVLSYQFWKTAYGGAADAIGKTININGQTYNIVGVMPQGFYFPNRKPQVYLPLQIAATDAHDYMHVSSWYFIARMSPRTNLATLNTALKARAQIEIGNLKPNERKIAKKQGYLLKAETLRDTLVGHAGTRLSLIECGAALLFALAV
ncbi:MAG TPA: ABC transporter permease, partial [Verrucomicrobiae bacterium]|nr:ABC transporter permease [Verrucomicrobiae bacterium]